jgi:hypothetical protein
MNDIEKQVHIDQLARYQRRFYLFCREVLGFKDLIAHSEEVLPEYSHEHFCDYLQFDSSLFKLILQPRYTFKSHITTIGKTLWDLVAKENLRFLFLSDTNDKSEGFLEGVKNHLEGKVAGSRFRELYGDWTVDPKRGVWNQEEIVIAPRTQAQVEPTISTAGIETSKTGKHYDKIIGDDLVSEKNVTTPELIQKVKDVYRKYLSVLRPGGELILLGTRWNHGDLYGQVVQEDQELIQKGLPRVFSTYVRQAEVEETYPYAPIGLTKEFLIRQRKLQGSYIYSCLYQNQPVDDETAMFKVKDFAFYTKVPDGLFITAALDPIPPNDTTQGDDAALTIVGTDPEMNMYVLEVLAGRFQPSEQIDLIFQAHAKWGIRTLAVESNHWQRTMLKDIETRVAQERRSNSKFRLFHVEPVTRGSQNSKHLDIRALQPYHERQAIRLQGTCFELLTGTMQKLAVQMQYYDKAPHDDLLDSLSLHVCIHQAGDVRKILREFPVTSAAWYEREVFRKQEVKALARRPRWHRSTLTPLAFS